MRIPAHLLVLSLLLASHGTALAGASDGPSTQPTRGAPAEVRIGSAVFVRDADQEARIENGKAVLVERGAGGPVAANPPDTVPVYRARGAATQERPFFGTDRVVVRADSAPTSSGLRDIRPLDGAPGFFVGRASSAWDAPAAAERAAAAPGVLAAYPDLLSVPVASAVPTDPFYACQWHLQNVGQNGATVDVDAELEGAWDRATGRGVNISVVDDGVQHAHPDLSAAYLASLSRDVCDGDSDPAPATSSDNHGTSVAGVALARAGNGLGGVGAAPGAGLAVQRLVSCGVSDSMIATALGAGTTTLDVSTNSWGWGANTLIPIYPATLAAMENNIQNGRGGLGMVYLFAAGNERLGGEDANYQGFTASRYVATVGAVDSAGAYSYYSTPCSCLLVSAPSNGGNLGITTTDRTGAAGYNAGSGGDYANPDYTARFGGTSSATPLVAGVVALMLEANPRLTWRDVQAILATTASRGSLGATQWTTNAAGHMTSRDFGFGLVDATAAVARATTWPGYGPELVSTATRSTGLLVPDAGSATQTLALPQDLTIERVVLTFSATHPYRGDLRLVLTSPSGTESVLVPGRANDDGDGFASWQASSTQFFGERAAGTWTLNATDRWPTDAGRIDSFTITAYGHARDTTPPGVAAATVHADVLRLAFDETLDAGYPPSAAAFTVTVDGVAQPAPTSVMLAGRNVTLALAAPVAHGAVVTVAYANASAGLRDAAGNLAPSFADLTAENVTPDPTPPQAVSASVNGTTLRIAYSEPLQPTPLPALSAFTVRVDGATRAVSSLGVAGSDVSLVLEASVGNGTAVTLDYAPPALDALRDTDGNAAGALTGFVVNNTTPDVAPPVLLSAAANGTRVTLQFDEPLGNASAIDPAAFSVRAEEGHLLVVSNASTAGTVLALGLSEPVVEGESVTLSYAPPAGHPLQDPWGNAFPALSERVVNNTTPDASPPSVSGAYANGTRVVLRYSEPLTDASVPDGSSYLVAVGLDAPAAPTAVHVTGRNVTLTLAAELPNGSSVAVAYSPGESPLRDRAGKPAPAFSGLDVPNRTPDVVPPRLVDAYALASELTLVFDEPLAGSTPAPTDFAVAFDGVAQPGPLGVAAAGLNATLRLARPVANGSLVQASYHPAQPALADRSGNHVGGFSNRTVRNLAPDVTAPELLALARNGSVLVLAYSEALTASTSTPGAWMLHANGAAEASPANATMEGANVTLAFAAPFPAGAVLGLSYDGGVGAVRDAWGNAAPPFVDVRVPNPPPLVSAKVNGTRLDVAFEVPLDAAATPPGSDFALRVDSAAQPAPLAVRVEDRNVTLTLAEAVPDGRAAALSYAPSQPGLRDLAGNGVEPVTNLSVVVETPDSTPPSLALASEPAAPDGLGGAFVTAPRITLDATDATSGIASIAYCLTTNETCEPEASFTEAFVLPEGFTRVVAVATDGVGLESPVVSETFVVDLTPPTVSVSGATGTVPASAGVSILFEFSEPMDTESVRLALVGGDGWSLAWSHGDATLGATRSGLAPGAHTLTLGTEARDANGSRLLEAVSRTFTVQAPPAPAPAPLPAPAPSPPALKVPAAPADLVATPGDGSVALSWSAPSDGGSPVKGYRVFVDGRSVMTPNAETRHVVTGLENGVAYTLQVAAVNGVGPGGRSAAVTATPVAPPPPAPPATLLAAAAPGGRDGWHLKPVVVALSAEPAAATIRYSLDGGEEQSYGAPLTIGAGIHELRYRALHAGAPDEEPRAAVFRVDLAPPALSAPSVAPASVVPGERVRVAVSASDDASGLAHVVALVQAPSGTVQKVPLAARDGLYVGEAALSEVGEHAMEATATDAVGRTARVALGAVMVEAPPEATPGEPHSERPGHGQPEQTPEEPAARDDPAAEPVVKADGPREPTPKVAPVPGPGLAVASLALALVAWSARGRRR